jgi:hypothetical protein
MDAFDRFWRWADKPSEGGPTIPAELHRVDAAADQAIAACGGDARETVKVLLVANEFLEVQPGLFLIAYAALVGWRGSRATMPKPLVLLVVVAQGVDRLRPGTASRGARSQGGARCLTGPIMSLYRSFSPTTAWPQARRPNA